MYVAVAGGTVIGAGAAAGTAPAAAGTTASSTAASSSAVAAANDAAAAIETAATAVIPRCSREPGLLSARYIRGWGLKRFNSKLTQIFNKMANALKI